MTPNIIEGTPHELASIFAQHPNSRFRLLQIEQVEEPEFDETKPVIDAENAKAIALLDVWIAEGACADEETKRKADEELAEFKRNMNANRTATGESLVYP